MADKYERYLMKQKMKEARHQAKLDEIRRKRELAEIKNSRTKTVGSFLFHNSRFIFDVLVLLFLAAGIFIPLFILVNMAK